MDDPGPEEPMPTEASDETPDHGLLRGTFVAVVMMSAFFVIVWFGMFMLAMGRR